MWKTEEIFEYNSKLNKGLQELICQLAELDNIDNDSGRYENLIVVKKSLDTPFYKIFEQDSDKGYRVSIIDSETGEIKGEKYY